MYILRIKTNIVRTVKDFYKIEITWSIFFIKEKIIKEPKFKLFR
jgi:hypothetical protein